MRHYWHIPHLLVLPGSSVPNWSSRYSIPINRLLARNTMLNLKAGNGVWTWARLSVWKDMANPMNSVTAIEPAAIAGEQDNSVNTMGMVFKGKRTLGETVQCDQALTGSLLAASGSLSGTSQIIKEFDGVDLKSWVRDLNDEMAVACCLAIKDLKVWLNEQNAKFLTLDQVESIFNNCNYVVKDETSLKHVSGFKTYEEKDLNNTNISSWIRDLFQKQDKQTMVTDSLLAHMMVEESFLNQLAAKVIEYRATEEIPISVNGAKAKILELGTIHFSGKEDLLSLVWLQLFALFDNKASQIEIEYKREDFRPFSAAIDTTIATKAREKLRIQATFDF